MTYHARILKHKRITEQQCKRKWVSSYQGPAHEYSHYNDVTWASWCLRLLASRMLVEHLFRLTSKNHENSHYWSFVRGIHQWLVDSPHKGPEMWKMFPYNDAIIEWYYIHDSNWGGITKDQLHYHLLFFSRKMTVMNCTASYTINHCYHVENIS